jgi:nucleotide-binding universal stress UspA family protein
MRLRLVAVIESELDEAALTPVEMYDFTAIARLANQASKDLAAEELKAVAARIELDSPVTSTVVVGSVAPAVIAEAVTSGSALIVCGAARGSHRFVPKGISTALGLMADAPVPVLVMNDICPLDLRQTQQSLLIADDLSANCAGVPVTACNLAIAIGHTDVHHVHVNALSMETLASAAEKSIAMHGEMIFKDVGPSVLWEIVQRDLQEHIIRRSKGAGERIVAAGGQYCAKLRNGRVESELEKAVEATQANILVFGRHHSLHRKPFAIGKVPFHMMLAHNRALVVVP